MKVTIYYEPGYESLPQTIATVEAADSLSYIEVYIPETADGHLYLTRQEASALSNALLWASAEASD